MVRNPSKQEMNDLHLFDCHEFFYIHDEKWVKVRFFHVIYLCTSSFIYNILNFPESTLLGLKLIQVGWSYQGRV